MRCLPPGPRGKRGRDLEIWPNPQSAQSAVSVGTSRGPPGGPTWPGIGPYLEAGSLGHAQVSQRACRKCCARSLRSVSPRALLERRGLLLQETGFGEGGKRLFQADGGLRCHSDPRATDVGLRPPEAEIARTLGEGDRWAGHGKCTESGAGRGEGRGRRAPWAGAAGGVDPGTMAKGE